MNTSPLYKYRPVNKLLIESIINREIYFSSLGNLNDPIDCHIDIRRSFDIAIHKASGKQQKNLKFYKGAMEGFISAVEDRIQSFGIWCGSLEPNNSLMWENYADEHRGICLLYSFPGNIIKANADALIGIHPVEYTDNPIVNWLTNSADLVPSLNFSEFPESLIVKLLTSKDQCWKYQREGRVISLNPGSKKIAQARLQQICFGLKTPIRDRALMVRILKQQQYEVSICKIVRAKHDFGLALKELPEKALSPLY